MAAGGRHRHGALHMGLALHFRKIRHLPPSLFEQRFDIGNIGANVRFPPHEIRRFVQRGHGDDLDTFDDARFRRIGHGNHDAFKRLLPGSDGQR